MEARRRDQRCELLDKILRREDDVGRAVAPAVLEAIEERSVRESGEALGGDRRAGHVAAQTLEPAPISGRDGHVGVQAHAANARAALALQDLDVVDVDAVAEAQHALAGAPARGDAAADRGGVERGEERLLVREPVHVRAVGQAAALEQALDTPRNLGGDAGDSSSSGGGRTRQRNAPCGVRA